MATKVYPLSGDYSPKNSPLNKRPSSNSIHQKSVIKGPKKKDDQTISSSITLGEKSFSSLQTAPSDSQILADILHGNSNDLHYYQTIIKPKLSFFYDLREKGIDEEFITFNFQNISSSFVFYLNLIVTIFLLPLNSLVLIIIPHLDSTFNSKVSCLFIFLSFLASLCSCITGWIVYSLNVNDQRRSTSYASKTEEPQQLHEKISSWLTKFHRMIVLNPILIKYRPIFQRLFIISLHLIFIAKFILVQLNSRCPNMKDTPLENLASSWLCGNDETAVGSPRSSNLIMLVGSFVCCIALREPRWWFCFLMHSITLFTFLGFYYDSLQAMFVATVVGWWLGGGLLFLDLHKQCLLNYFMTNHFRVVLMDNAKYAEQVQANEMKHMIANVAHDLKTVRLYLVDFLMNVFHMKKF